MSTETFLQEISSTLHRSEQAEWAALVACALPNPNALQVRSTFPSDLNWPSLQERALEHGMLPLLTRRLQAMDPSPVPEAIRNSLCESQRAQTALALRLTAELFRVLDRFAEAGIETLVTKGPVLSVRCYGDPGMRQYGDLDLVVRHRDIQRSTQTMLDLGYRSKVPVRVIEVQKIPGEYTFRNSDDQVLVEFHTERTFRYHPRRLNIEELFHRKASVVIDGRGVPALSVEDELVLISIHGSKHFWERLMWIADVAALISSGTFGWNRAIESAREVSAERILRVALRLAADVLGARLPSPLEAEIRSDRAVGRLANQITRRLASSNSMGILERAAFRVKMRGGMLDGAAYLLRLSFSPTEDDWLPGREHARPWLLDAIGRPLRLARKHRRRTAP